MVLPLFSVAGSARNIRILLRGLGTRILVAMNDEMELRHRILIVEDECAGKLVGFTLTPTVTTGIMVHLTISGKDDWLIN